MVSVGVKITIICELITVMASISTGLILDTLTSTIALKCISYMAFKLKILEDKIVSIL